MREFVEAIRQLQVQDLLRLLVILGPLVIAIWAAINWAYKTRLDQLTKSLELLRGDRDLELKRLRERLEDEQAQAVGAIRTELQNMDIKCAEAAAMLSELRSDFAAFHELAENMSTHKDALRHWWLVFDRKYFKVRDQRHNLMRRDPGMEFLNHNPKPRLLVQWEKEHGNKIAEPGDADVLPQPKPPT